MTAAEVAGTWIGSIYAHPDRPTVKHRDILVFLAVDPQFACKDSPDERSASPDTLAKVCAVSRSTVQRALKWARAALLLVCVSRGHRVVDGIVTNSRWRLVVA